MQVEQQSHALRRETSLWPQQPALAHASNATDGSPCGANLAAGKRPAANRRGSHRIDTMLGLGMLVATHQGGDTGCEGMVTGWPY
jgi:hypothetical protein